MSGTHSYPLFDDVKRTLKAWRAILGSLRMFTHLRDVRIGRWEPEYSGRGTLTWTNVKTKLAVYVKLGPLVWQHVFAFGDAGGTAANAVRFTPKFRPRSYGITGFGMWPQQGWAAFASTYTAECYWHEDEETFHVLYYDRANLTASGTGSIGISGWYLTDE